MYFSINIQSKECDTVRVVVRCRPMNQKEIGQGFKSAIKVSV